MKIDDIKQSVNSLWTSAREGWRQLIRSGSGSLTSFKSEDSASVPSRSEVDDEFYLPSLGWSVLGGNVFEDEQRVVVSIEVPGMEKENFNIEVIDEMLVVRGQKRFEHESSEGRYRSLQCAYGSFRREIWLPVPVRVDRAEATYRNGVLRIELPKAPPGPLRSKIIKID
jgi:HSP20 family protein